MDLWWLSINRHIMWEILSKTTHVCLFISIVERTYRLTNGMYLLLLRPSTCGFVKPADEYLVTRNFVYTRNVFYKNSKYPSKFGNKYSGLGIFRTKYVKFKRYIQCDEWWYCYNIKKINLLHKYKYPYYLHIRDRSSII